MAWWWSVALGLGLAAGQASAGEGLDAAAVAQARAARDVATLLAGPYDAGVLPAVAQALGEARDPAALERLTLLARLDDPSVRAAALTALGRIEGGEIPLREALAQEVDVGVRTAGWRALGAVGDRSDVAGLARALGAAVPEACSAADGLAALAIRGVDVSEGQDALWAALDAAGPLRGPVRGCAAHALYRSGPVPGGPGRADRLDRLRRGSPRDTVRAWLLRVAWNLADDRQRAAWGREVLDHGSRQERALWMQDEAVRAALPSLGRDLAAHADPWVRMLAAPDTAPVQGDLEATARSGASPAERTRAARAWLAGMPDTDGVVAWLGMADPAVRELALDHLAALGAGCGAIGPAAAQEDDVAVLLAWTRLAAQCEDHADATAFLRAVAASGPWGVRRAAFQALPAEEQAQHPFRPVAPAVTPQPEDGPVALEVQTTQGVLRIALDPAGAPIGVAAMRRLATEGALDDRAWHRVVPGFVAQTGDPRGDGLGHAGFLLPDELSDAPFVAGSVGMARAGHDTASSQWFVVLADAPHLRGRYTHLGQVTAGLDVARRLTPSDRVVSVTVVSR